MLRMVKEEFAMVGSFDDFWELYPKKVAKKDARMAWQKIKVTAEMWARIVESIAAHKVSEGWLDRGGLFIPHAATWINGERWDDEVEVALKIMFCRWRGCGKAGTKKIGEFDFCETHFHARKRGESPV